VEQHKPRQPLWKVSFELCETSAERAITALQKECERRTDLVEGDPLVDGHTYSSRMTVLAGLFAASAIRKRIAGANPADDFAFHFIQRNLRHAFVWGESAIPYFLSAVLLLECGCRPIPAEMLLIRLVGEIAAQNGTSAQGRGFPNPYYSPEQALRLHTGIDSLNPETFASHSYTIETLVHMLARRWRRQALASLWFSLTRIQLSAYAPASAAEWYRWRSSAGALESRFAGEPQSWEKLRESAETLSFHNLPESLIARPEFAPWFMLVYPHRMTPELVMLVETALRS
jgi:hypothetical protein